MADEALRNSPRTEVGTRKAWNRRQWLLAAPSLLASMAMPAVAARAADQPLTMGVFPRFHLPIKLFMPMANYLGQRIGRKINLVTAKNFNEFWTGVTERRYDIVHYNQYHYIRSAKTYEAIAHIEEFDKSTISGAIYVRKDNSFNELSQLRGRTVIFGGGEDAMMSYIVPRYQLLQAGLRADDFKSLFAVSPPNAVIALGHGQADAAGAGDGMLKLQSVMDATDIGALTALAVSTPLLQLPIAVKRDASVELRESIQSALIDLNKTATGRQVLASAMMSGIGKAKDSDYDPHRAIVKAVFPSIR